MKADQGRGKGGGPMIICPSEDIDVVDVVGVPVWYGG